MVTRYHQHRTETTVSFSSLCKHKRPMLESTSQGSDPLLQTQESNMQLQTRTRPKQSAIWPSANPCKRRTENKQRRSNVLRMMNTASKQRSKSHYHRHAESTRDKLRALGTTEEMLLCTCTRCRVELT